ncbi:MAG: hypothetical protein ACYDDQ_08735 [Vulcanimicrobiaceae bacterium]
MRRLYSTATAILFAIASSASILAHAAQHPSSVPAGFPGSTASVALADGGNDHRENRDGHRWYPRSQNCRQGNEREGERNAACGYGYAPYGGQYNGYYGGNQAQIQGVVTSVSGDRVTIMQGLFSSVTVYDQPALDTGRAYNLYLGRTVTAYGYWSGNVFYATSIG